MVQPVPDGSGRPKVTKDEEGSLRASELDKAAHDIKRVVETTNSFVKDLEYIDSKLKLSKKSLETAHEEMEAAVVRLKSLLSSASVLERRANSIWAIRDLGLSKKLLLPKLISDLGGAILGLNYAMRRIPSFLNDAGLASSKMTGLSGKIKSAVSIARKEALESVDSMRTDR